ncbi:MAG TPA: IS200/IS605 family transposase [Turneriella sp.]|nr:IS200/IS605 family transposase [Turneriella sp.]
MLKKGNSYYELYYHVVFATKRREAMLSLAKISEIREIVKRKSDEMGFLSHIVNGYVDHIHMLVTIPPSLAIATVVKHIKGVSSRSIDELYWQEGYWVQGIEKKSVSTVAAYIENQWHHHQTFIRQGFKSLPNENDLPNEINLIEMDYLPNENSRNDHGVETPVLSGVNP